MEEGHLIDRYIVENMRRVQSADYLRAANLRKQDMWDPHMGAKLSRLLDESMKTTVPVCKDCNMAMTKENSEVLAVFHGILRAAWFVDGVIPFNTLRTTRKNLSVPKTLEAIFIFFTLQPKPPKALAALQDEAAREKEPQKESDPDKAAGLEWARVSHLLNYNKNMDDDDARLVVGLPVRKYFAEGPAGWYDGHVVDFNLDEGSNMQRIFGVRFTDGDEEDFSWAQLKKIRVTTGTPPASFSATPSKSRARKAKGTAAVDSSDETDSGPGSDNESSEPLDTTAPLVWVLKSKEE
eukprot:1440051-Rhodomonas_salina.1